MAGWLPVIEPLLTPGEAADMLAVSVNTLREWDRAGLWPAGAVKQTPGGRRRYAAGCVQAIAAGEPWPP